MLADTASYAGVNGATIAISSGSGLSKFHKYRVVIGNHHLIFGALPGDSSDGVYRYTPRGQKWQAGWPQGGWVTTPDKLVKVANINNGSFTSDPYSASIYLEDMRVRAYINGVQVADVADSLGHGGTSGFGFGDPRIDPPYASTWRTSAAQGIDEFTAH
jgi:hypothetical protein